MSATPEKPTVCVALATYQGERFLGLFLESLCAQTLLPNRVIVVDDASTDATVDILQSYAGRLPLELEIRKSNGGHRVSFSHVLSLVREDFVALADQDDIWEPEKLQVLMAEIGAADLVHCDASIIDGEGHLICPSWHAEMALPAEQPVERYLAGFNNVTGCTALFRRELCERAVPVPDAVPVHDWWIALLAMLGNGVRYVPRPLIRYRLHDANAVGKGSHLTVRETLQQQEQWFALLRAKSARLRLNERQDLWVRNLWKLVKARQTSYMLMGWAPFVWKYQDLLFVNQGGRLRRLGRIGLCLFGLPFLQKVGKR